jgi:glycosyltransferase involved in cell wall biosynthesis
VGRRDPKVVAVKIAVVNNAVPFLRGGAEFLADWLTERLQQFGHSAMLVRIPFRWDPPEKILDTMLACQMIGIANCDRVIPLKFPAYLVPHPNKVLWLLHQFRQAYDLWGTPLQFLPDDEYGAGIRNAIRAADNAALSKARIYTNSRVTSERLMHFNGIASEVLFPPLQNPEQYRCDTFGDYIFCPSRINDAKRQHLLVESMAFTRTPVRLIIAGKPEESVYLDRIRATVAKHDLSGKVTVIPEFISDETKVDLFAAALGCAYIPYDEDSYGYVTMESFESRKPVVTCTDSGGIDILVRSGDTGLIVAPEPCALAEAFDALYDDRQRAREMGKAGRDMMYRMGINWENVIARLTS